MCQAAHALAGAPDALASDLSLTPRQRRASQRAQLAILRNHDLLFVRMLPLLDPFWRDPSTHHSLLSDAVLRLRVRMVRMLARKLRSPEGLVLRSEALVHLLQSWPSQERQSFSHHQCLVALLGDETLSDFPLPPDMGWLGTAALTDNLRLVEMLFEMGAPSSACSATGGSLLHVATEMEAPRLLAWSLGKGLNPNEPDKEGETPLHIAARCGNLEVLIRLVEAGGSLDVANRSGQTPLAFFEPLGAEGWDWYHRFKARRLSASLTDSVVSIRPQQRF